MESPCHSLMSRTHNSKRSRFDSPLLRIINGANDLLRSGMSSTCPIKIPIVRIWKIKIWIIHDVIIVLYHLILHLRSSCGTESRLGETWTIWVFLQGTAWSTTALSARNSSEAMAKASPDWLTWALDRWTAPAPRYKLHSSRGWNSNYQQVHNWS